MARSASGVVWTSASLVVYSYVGYPVALVALVQLRARLRPLERADGRGRAGPLPTLSLIIAAHDEELSIRAKLENALAHDYPAELLEVIVATDGSTDATSAIVTSYASRGVKLSHQAERRGKTAAITRAVEAATGSILVFSDANNHYTPRTLLHLVAPFADRSVGATTGAKRVMPRGAADRLGESEGLYWRYESFIKEQETKLGSTTGVAGEVLAIRRDLWQAPPPEVINDDFYLAATLLKRGYRVVYVPDAVSMERSTASETDERIRRTRIIAGRYQALAMARDVLPLGRPLLAWQMLSHKFTRPLVPFAMIGMALGSVAAAVAAADGTPRSRLGLGRAGARVALALQAVFYVFATVGRIRLLPGRAGRAAYVAAFLVDSNLAALAGFVRYRRGGQSAAWQRVRRDG